MTAATVQVDRTVDDLGRFNLSAVATELRRIIRGRVDLTVRGCWEYRGARSRRGYCDIRIKGRSLRVHRVSYAAFVGPFDNNLLICHRCDNPPCCNPEHLFPGDHKANALDASSKHRLNTPGPSGQGHPCVTVLDDLASIAIWRYYTGESQRAIAADLGVSQGSVSNWVLGKTRPYLIEEAS